MSNIPAVGQSIVVRHRSNGNGKIIQCPNPVKRTIKAVNIGGTVTDSFGEVWNVEPNRVPKINADWMSS